MRNHRASEPSRAFVLVLLVLLLGGAGAPSDPGPRAAFPGADRFGAPEGAPPAAPAYRGGELLGYLLSTKQVTAGGGYGARPLDVLVGLGLDCRIAGAELLEQHEPILMIGVGADALAGFVRQYAGLDAARRVRIGAAPEGQSVQAISRATISSFALHDAILGAARAVARARGLPCALGAGGGAARLELDAFRPEGWEELRAAGSVARLRITAAEAAGALRRAGAPNPAAALLPPDANYATLYAALATPAQIGANLLGQAEHARLLADAAPGSNLVFVAGEGAYSFKGTSWVRTGAFDRVQIAQGERTIGLVAAQHRQVERIRAAGAPEPREAAVFVLPPESGFDPALPWRLELAVSERRPEGGPALALFALPYALPERHLRPAPPAEAAPEDHEGAAAPPWHRAWELRSGRLAVLALALLAVCAVVLLQNPLARRPRLWRAVRLSGLAFTLGWLGWYAGAQLSVVNLISFAAALSTGFSWEPFLLDPLGFVLWAFVAASLLFWARGVFCGWLCPFGALQELLNLVARRLRVPQVTVPFALHERLWPAKYIVFLVLLGLSLGPIEAAVAAAEVEPFKTAITLHFQRPWPFVAYALALLTGGLFIERMFCRYLCPLGAALALPARIRVFDWLKRHKQCGAPCQLCARSCPVQAIHPEGRINPNECINCLKCQTLYYDEQACPAVRLQIKLRGLAAVGAGGRP
ncbi:regulatory protein NosR [Craurococcus roseus]|uniref:Regulatory protein NosR n=1 Tax=Craurococcus roseus TaxID=77585 RepID=A0ABP3QQ73_9PROT